MAVEITLAWYEIIAASMTGILRYADQVRGEKDKCFKTTKGEHPCMIDINGAGAEVALGKFLGLYPIPGVSTSGLADVAPNIEVRQTSWMDKDKGRLRIRFREMESETKQHRPYVLVRGQIPKFQIIGWIYGKECMKKEYVDDPGGHGPCWWVPEEALTPLTEGHRGKRSLYDW